MTSHESFLFGKGKEACSCSSEREDTTGAVPLPTFFRRLSQQQLDVSTAGWWCAVAVVVVVGVQDRIARCWSILQKLGHVNEVKCNFSSFQTYTTLCTNTADSANLSYQTVNGPKTGVFPAGSPVSPHSPSSNHELQHNDTPMSCRRQQQGHSTSFDVQTRQKA